MVWVSFSCFLRLVLVGCLPDRFVLAHFLSSLMAEPRIEGGGLHIVKRERAVKGDKNLEALVAKWTKNLRRRKAETALEASSPMRRK